MNIELLKGRAIESIRALYSTPDIPESATLDALKEVRDELEIRIDALETQMGSQL